MNLEILKKFKAPQSHINEIEEASKKQGDTSELEMEQTKILFKLFNPVGAGTWYVYEIFEDGVAMCFALLDEPMFAECGTISFDEMASLKLPFGLTIELDRSFPIGEKTLKEVYEEVKGEF